MTALDIEKERAEFIVAYAGESEAGRSILTYDANGFDDGFVQAYFGGWLMAKRATQPATVPAPHFYTFTKPEGWVSLQNPGQSWEEWTKAQGAPTTKGWKVYAAQAGMPASGDGLTDELIGEIWMSVLHIAHATQRQIAFARAIAAHVTAAGQGEWGTSHCKHPEYIAREKNRVASASLEAVSAAGQGGEDARRLDFLGKHCAGASDSERYLPFRLYWGNGQSKTIREVIDAAIAAKDHAK